MQRFGIIIPAFKPDLQLLQLLDALRTHSEQAALVVVDDGSGPQYEPVFSAIQQRRDVTLLRHSTNLGQGAALKTAFRYALAHLPDCGGFITADCDGQHAPDDILSVAAAWAAHPECLVLGVRDFTFGHGVPFRSLLGNRLSSLTFRLASVRVSDTQTGLRGIPRACLPALLAIPHDRFEFQTAMLIAAHREGLTFLERLIATIYLNQNKGSHFRPLRDSYRIYRVLLKSMFD